MMRRVSADNHRGQGVKNSHQQAGYMRAMISSHISDQLSCKPEWVHICRRYESRDGLGRAKQDARAESNAGSNCREDPAVINQILAHLDEKAVTA